MSAGSRENLLVEMDSHCLSSLGSIGAGVAGAGAAGLGAGAACCARANGESENRHAATVTLRCGARRRRERFINSGRTKWRKRKWDWRAVAKSGHPERAAGQAIQNKVESIKFSLGSGTEVLQLLELLKSGAAVFLRSFRIGLLERRS